MIFVVAPERSSWLAPLRKRLGACEIFSPPAVNAAALLGSRLWARGLTDRVLSLRFARRRVTDELAARAIPRDATAVYAPCGAAERVFAVAKQRGIETVLVHDLPCLRELHADLDLAAAQFPECRFLRRFRASRAEIVRQETERVLADRILVRGAFAESLLSSRHARVEPTPEETRVARPARAPRTATFRLAGFAAARSGTNEALAMLDALPRATLLVRTGEGTEPARLLAHPRVRSATGALRVDALIAPSWCESYAPEVAAAHASGVPIIATKRALGFASGTVIEPGDVDALVRAAAQHQPHA